MAIIFVMCLLPAQISKSSHYTLCQIDNWGFPTFQVVRDGIVLFLSDKIADSKGEGVFCMIEEGSAILNLGKTKFVSR
jgi:hypothetical protein